MVKKFVEISEELWNQISHGCDRNMMQGELLRLGLPSGGTDEALRERLQEHLLKPSRVVQVSKSSFETTKTQMRLELKIDKHIFERIQKDQTFSVKSKPTKFGGYEWYLDVANSRDEEDEEKRYIGAFLHSTPGKLRDGDFVSYSIHVDRLRHTLVAANMKTDFTDGWGKRSALEFKFAKKYDSLTFACNITLISGFTVRNEETSSVQSLQLFRLNEIMSQNTGDLTIILKDDTEIKAHKVVLTSHSPVFTAMFSHSLAESLEENVKIDDFEPEEVKNFIEILYSGFVPKEADFSSLFMLADKYNIDILAKHCLKQLVRSRTVENCVELMLNMERFNYLDDDAEKKCLASFMFENYDTIRDQEAFTKLNRDSLLLIFDCRGKKRKFNSD